jgi:hypothetical protein
MEKTISRWAVAGALTLGLAAIPVMAQEKATDKKREPNQGEKSGDGTAATNPVSMLATAERLASYGDEKKDPLALILAARMKQEVGESPVKREKENKGEKGEPPKSPKRDTSVQGLLERAKKLAQGRKDIVALADEVAKSGTRGAEGGPKVNRTVVLSKVTDVYRIRFRGGQLAEVAIAGDGDSDLDLYVYDEFGNLMCRAVSRSDHELCQWFPRRDALFTIRVLNLGVANYYGLATN